ncbi:39S ribosomal protein L2, mitochondrial [Frankliniella fusca]|uniref:39S ribosomal protein L2, mitochondrial n=1 Tax=Frankliniella fusca TaxID=407009 RepID=A0AAE1H0G4_9NEOP|nr:39S ribosomal protein L2, mitochondrial [Frankliniella fusca]
MPFFLSTLAFQLKAVTSLPGTCGITCAQVRFASKKIPSLYDQFLKPRPKPGEVCLKRIVHYEDEYTVKPLNVTRLGGRDPVTGRKIHEGWGGGIKHKYHWVHWNRIGPTEDVPPIEERVIQIVEDKNRSAKLALVAGGDKMKYYLATVNMKPGDIVRTSSYIPPIPVTPNEGDAYPVGALPIGTIIHNLQKTPNADNRLLHAAGTFATIIKKNKNQVIIKMPSKHEFIVDPKCMACVGRVGNVDHARTPIGSAQKWRQLGFRPRSGLWQRKTGRFGRKLRAPKKLVMKDAKQPLPVLNLDE